MTTGTIEKDTNTRTPIQASLATHARIILAVIITATFLDVVDFSVVQVALPTIQSEFRAPLAESQWIIGVYGLTLAGFLIVSGRAGDLYGQKRLFVLGIGTFTAASLTAGFSPSLLILIVARAIQGVAAAVTTATALAILAGTFPEGEPRNRAIGILVSFLSAGFAAGSIAGGVLTAAFGWRSVMFVNVPIGAVAILLSQRFIAPEGKRSADVRLDVPGAVAVTSGLILLVYALTNAATAGFLTFGTALPLVSSLVVLGGFVAIENRSEAPLMPMAFLRRGSILTANVLALILSSSAGGLILLTVFMQGALRYTALQAGLAFLPAALIFFFVGGWGSSWLVDRLGLKRVLVLATALSTVGLALLAPISISAGYFGILPGTVLWSLGASVGFPALAVAGLAGAKRGEEGLASGLIQTSQRLGFPLGLGLLLTIGSSLDPQMGIDGMRYAFLASAALSAIGLAIAAKIETPSNSGSVVEGSTGDGPLQATAVQK